MIAFVDLTSNEPLILPGDPFCRQVPPAYAPPVADFAFCSIYLVESWQDTFAVGGVPTRAVLYIGRDPGLYQIYADLSRTGAIKIDYPIPEPTTLTLLGAGLLVTGAVLRKRRPGLRKS